MQAQSTRGVQQHEVNAAAEALLALHQRPTVARVRERLGRGSPNRVGPMLESWFTTLAPRLGIVTSEGEEGAPAAVRQAVDEIWQAALDEAQGRARAALQEERDALRREQTSMEGARAAFAAREAAVGEREQLLREALETAKARETQLSAEASEMRQRITDLEGEIGLIRGSLADLVQQKDAAQREHERQTQRHAQEREKLTSRAEATERHLIEEIDRARQEVKSAQKTVAEAERRALALKEDLERRQQADAAAIRALELDRATLRERLAGAQQRSATLEALLAAPGKPATKRSPKSKRATD